MRAEEGGRAAEGRRKKEERNMQIGVKEQRSDGSYSVSLILCLPPYLGDGRRAAVSRNCSQFTAFQRLQLNQDAAPLLRIFARATERSGRDDPAGVSVSRSFVSHQVRERIEKGKTARAAAMPPERMERETGRERKRGRGKGVVFGPLGHWATMPTRLQ